MKNYYDILEVSRKASKDTINKVFKMHMKANHPDLFQGAEKTKAEEKSKELTEAYNILSDDASRAKYDEELGAEESQGQYVQVQAIMEENEHLKQIIEKKTKVIDILSSIYGDNEIQSIVNNIDFGDDRFNNGMSSEAQYYSDVQQSQNFYSDKTQSYANMTDEELKNYKENEKREYYSSLFKVWGQRILISVILIVALLLVIYIAVSNIKALFINSF